MAKITSTITALFKGTQFGTAIIQLWETLSPSCVSDRQASFLEEELIALAERLAPEFPPTQPPPAPVEVIEEFEQLEVAPVTPDPEPEPDPIPEPTEPTEPAPKLDNLNVLLSSIISPEDATTMKLDAFTSQGILTISDALAHRDLADLEKIGTKTRDRLLAAIAEYQSTK